HGRRNNRALLIWIFGATFGRVIGALITIYALIQLTRNNMDFHAWQYLAAGIALWLAGHWLWAYKHQAWRNHLALNLFSQPLIHHLAPIPTNRQPRSAGADT
ncbi:hypothetical protein B2J88_51310, partial [Rhodococcus sp. SRB_17]|nr:hypothetical protein [Rhodococcus sp. SRB_17]